MKGTSDVTLPPFSAIPRHFLYTYADMHRVCAQKAERIAWRAGPFSVTQEPSQNSHIVRWEITVRSGKVPSALRPCQGIWHGYVCQDSAVIQPRTPPLLFFWLNRHRYCNVSKKFQVAFLAGIINFLMFAKRFVLRKCLPAKRYFKYKGQRGRLALQLVILNK